MNSLSRFSKTSSRYILEAHSHCEVPAGCGGVVLRWRDPKNGVPLTFRVYAGGSYQFYLDGHSLSSGRPIIPFGDHVISLVVGDFDPTRVVLLFAAKYEEKGAELGHTERTAASRLHFLSAPDGSWKYSWVEPRDGSWQQPGFEDSAWATMPAREWASEPTQQQSMQSYRAQELIRMGAQGLGVDRSLARVWIRRSFTVVPPD